MADDTRRNIAAQVEMYGEPLARVFGRLVEQLGMTQAALARTLGMSPAMLSHLSSGTRVKIGNPAVQRRLDEVRTLAEQIGRGEVSRDEVQPLLDGIRESTGSWTATRHDAPDQGETDRDATEAATVRALLRLTGTVPRLQAAVALLEPEHPQLAELVRTYGIRSLDDATEHLRRHRDRLEP